MRFLLIALLVLVAPIARATLTPADQASLSSINLLTNGGFENGRAGWTTYNDAAGTSPVDGTGGTSSTPLTISSSPLSGKYAGLLSKPASNRQGDGISTDFVVPQGFRNRVITCRFDYDASSNFTAGTSSSIRAWIYDKTNAALIPLSSSTLDGGSATYPQAYKAYFQTPANMAAGRLILHVADSGSTAFTVKVDNVWCGREQSNTGPFISDWASYTPTVSAASGGTAKGTRTEVARWRRVAGEMEIEYDYIQTVAGTAGTGNYFFNIPSGYTIDTTKYANLAASGVGGAGPAIGYDGTNSFVGNSGVYDSTNITAFFVNDTTAYSQWSATRVHLGNASVRWNIKAKVPILGWNASASVTPDPLVALTVNPGSATGTLNSSENQVTFSGTIQRDTASAWTSSNTYTVPIAGLYRIYAQLELSHASATVNNAIVAIVYINGVARRYGPLIKVASTSVLAYYPTVEALEDLSAGDTIKIYVTDQATTPAYGSSTGKNFVLINRLSGPSSVQPTEFVGGRFTGSATAISGSATTVVWTNTDYLSGGSYASGIYTVPIPGRYRVTSGMLLTAASAAVGNAVGFTILKNGVTITSQDPVYQSTQVFYQLFISDEINCVTGDQLSVKVASSATTPSINASTTRNYMAISRVGN